MSNKFIEVFDKVYEDEYKSRYKNKGGCVCGELNDGKRFTELKEETNENLPAFAAWTAEEIKDNIKPTQLRRFYTYVKSIERNAREDKNGVLDSKSKAKLMFLLPKLAGSANVKKKKEEKAIKVLHDIFATCIQKNKKIKSKEDLERFVEFFEAILDYHSTLQKS